MPVSNCRSAVLSRVIGADEEIRSIGAHTRRAGNPCPHAEEAVLDGEGKAAYTNGSVSLTAAGGT